MGSRGFVLCVDSTEEQNFQKSQYLQSYSFSKPMSYRWVYGKFLYKVTVTWKDYDLQ